MPSKPSTGKACFLMTWTPPPVWSVPKEWDGDTCFILCGGESIKAQRDQIQQLPGRIIAVKHTALLKPDAEVLFWSGEHAETLAPPVLKVFTGQYIVVRGKGHPVFPSHAKRVDRTDRHYQLCDDPTRVSGYDTGTSAINLAYHFGATTIVLLGYDMLGPSGSPGMPQPPEHTFRTHMLPLPLLAVDAERKGIRIVNVSPISRVECFERGRLEDFL